MNFFDYSLDALLILLVLLQLRPTRFGARAILLPLALAGAVGVFYLRGFPTQGNDLTLILTLTLIGAAIGAASGAATRMWADAQRGILVQAGAVAAVLWILGMGSRALFQFWADGSGSDAVAAFSVQHGITGAEPWVTGLVLMALAQVIVRTIVLSARARGVRRQARGSLKDAIETSNNAELSDAPANIR